MSKGVCDSHFFVFGLSGIPPLRGYCFGGSLAIALRGHGYPSIDVYAILPKLVILSR